LSPETRELILNQCKDRVLQPVRDMVTGKRDPNWWLLTTNNWNAVCLAGVVGTALALEPSVEERALFVAAGEKYIQNFLRGFTEDGYCSEGVGYWNYGYGHFVLLAETLYGATSGKMNLYDMAGAAAPATYGFRIEILNGVCPAFADCSVRARPSGDLLELLEAVYGKGRSFQEPMDRLGSKVFQSMIYAFPSGSKASTSAKVNRKLEERDYFERAGILIARPGKAKDCVMAAAMKGGHNAEHHNHNDVGSFIVVKGDRPLLVDPGSETYTARTFSSRRYESNVLNSFGHPVPVVAGQLQRKGSKARGEVVRTEFQEDRDLLEIEMASAYEVESLHSLRRTFVYDRSDHGSLEVVDQVEMSSPQSFETALLTLGTWAKEGEDLFLAYDFDQAVRVRIDTGDIPYETEVVEIQEDCHGEPKRLAIRLSEPVKKARVTLTVRPVVDDEEDHSVLRNPGFERGSWCWDFHGSHGAISNERSSTGDYSLKIVDEEEGIGSSIWSSRVRAEEGISYTLRGQCFPVSGDGVGMYVYYLDKDGETLNERDKRGYVPSIGTLGGDTQTWEAFRFDFVTPPGTHWLQVWIHSYNASKVVAYLDDLEIVESKT